ncbi:MAG: hypothetical protein U5K75_08580 [Ahrensia sp.]|nr:hypothetical protein [Ahrensia sp.]
MAAAFCIWQCRRSKPQTPRTRLQLIAAAIASVGIYTAVDDGVFNPDLYRIEPGTYESCAQRWLAWSIYSAPTRSKARF